MSGAGRAALLAGLLALTAWCCLPAKDAPFTFDEQAGIASNRAVHQGVPWREALTYRFSPDQVRPLFFGLLRAEAALHSAAPRGYRVTSLLLHLLCGVLVGALLRRPFPGAAAPPRARDAAALAGTACFLLHPLQSESIIYIWGRSGVLSTLLAVAAILAAPEPAADGATSVPPAQPLSRRRRMARWIAALLLACLGLAAKEEAVLVPAIAFAWWTLAERRSARASLRPAAILAAPAVLFLAARATLLGAVGRQVFARHVVDNLLGQAVVTLRLLGLALAPVGQTIDPTAAVPRLAAGLAAAALCVGIVALAFALGRPRAHDAPVAVSLRRAAAGFVVAAIGVVLYWAVPLPDLMSERRAYLPLLGAALAVDGLVAALAMAAARGGAGARRPSAPGPAAASRDRRSRPASARLPGVLVVAPAALVALLLAPALHLRAEVWADSRRLWEEAARRSPAKARPLINLGVLAAEAGDRGRAADLFDRAVGLEPKNPEALYNRGKLRLDANDVDRAAADLEASALADPTVPRVIVNLGIARLRQGDRRSAEEDFRRALDLDPGDPRALTNLAELLRAEGRVPEALALYRDALASDPSYAHAAARLGVALEAAGDRSGALAAYRDYLLRGAESDADRRAVEAKIRALETALAAPPAIR